MPSGAKKRKAAKRKKEMANHNPPVDPQSPCHGDPSNGDSSDHVPTDEEFSPRAAMEASAEAEPAVGGESALLVPVEQRTITPTELAERTAVAEAAASPALEVSVPVNSSAPLQGVEESFERSEAEVATRGTSTEPSLPLERRAMWWNCCGLLDVFADLVFEEVASETEQMESNKGKEHNARLADFCF
ncbi:hypothetical protein AXF42_Ash009370 [Apostasia shenzhenica]|uniref:Uncharacterized protein n=1 Tax=Apostasia shenzhenica TaxID=1088818 RepID=A0A2I0B3W9_9ASPA|nr:hypothetical protein AXF42_Ash009370 [Apostasia shenzhenica]